MKNNYNLILFQPDLPSKEGILLKMKDYWIEPETKKINKKKISIIIICSVIIITLAIFIGIYINNKEAREWIDKNIFRKEVIQDNVTTIDLKEGQSNNIYAFNKYIGILNKNKLDIYANTGNKEKELEMQISNPLFNSANRFLIVGENKGQKVYLIEDKEIVWDTEIEGNIAQVHVNKNGYVAIVIVDTSYYKTVIAMYDPKGNEMFKKYLSTSRTADVDISNDNKYLAIAEVDTSGTMIQSNVRIISINDPANEQDETYQGEANKLITNIKYQDKNKLVCMYTDCIHVIEDKQDKPIINNENKKVTFQSVELTNHFISIEESSSGLFTADSVVKIVNTENKNEKEYTINSSIKEISTYGNIIALNLGTEVEFINTGGWLVKRYIANQEITQIAVSDNIASIIYRDKIEIVNL